MTSKVLLVNRTTLARILGISTRSVATFEAEGVIVASKRGRGGRCSQYAPEVVVPSYLSHVTAAPQSNDERAARARSLTATARLTELRIAKEEGGLLVRDDVVQAGQSFARGLSTKIRTLPRQLRQAGVLTTAEQEAAVAAMCRQMCVDISQWKNVEDAESAR